MIPYNPSNEILETLISLLRNKFVSFVFQRRCCCAATASRKIVRKGAVVCLFVRDFFSLLKVYYISLVHGKEKEKKSFVPSGHHQFCLQCPEIYFLDSNEKSFYTFFLFLSTYFSPLHSFSSPSSDGRNVLVINITL